MSAQNSRLCYLLFDFMLPPLPLGRRLFPLLLVFFVFLLPVDCSVHLSELSELSTVPSRIFFTDGTETHFSLALNAVKNYLSIGGDPEQIFVLVYDEQSQDFLKALNINTFYFANSIEEIRLLPKYFCSWRNTTRNRWMSLIMELKIRIWLELCRNGKQFVVFDSDTVFYQHPDVLFSENVTGAGVDIIAAYFLGKGLVERQNIVQEDYILDGVAEGKCELNFSPSAIINPQKMHSILSRMYYIVHERMASKKGCKTWGWGWGQVIPNIILYESGLRLREHIGGETTSMEWKYGCSEKKEYCLDRAINGGVTEAQSNMKRKKVLGKWAGIALKNRYFTHYAGEGQMEQREMKILESGDWYLPCNFLSSLSWEQMWDSVNMIMKPEIRCQKEELKLNQN